MITEGGFPVEREDEKKKKKKKKNPKGTRLKRLKSRERVAGGNDALVDWPKNEKEWRKMKKEKPLDFIMHKEKIGEQFSIEQNGKSRG